MPQKDSAEKAVRENRARRGTDRRALVVAPHRHHVFRRQVSGIAKCKAGSIPASAQRDGVTLWHLLAPHGTTGPNQVFRIAKQHR